RCATDPRWLPRALENLDQVLNDHAHCEKKAAANALSFLQAHPEIPGLPALMARLAREESAHLAKVLEIMESRGLTLRKDYGDPYVHRLLDLARTPAMERRLDRLLIAAIIEARSCERLALLASGLPEGSLKGFYAELAQSEDGHQALFFRLAALAHGEQEATARLDTLLGAEAKILKGLDVLPRIH
ncbi:MAG: tRNA-(ms[2]io[6]A)-hydroxylase, partial [Myxococcaceae bacterium]